MAKLRKKSTGPDTEYWPSENIVAFDVGSVDSLDCSVTYRITETLDIKIETSCMLKFLEGYSTGPFEPIDEFAYADNGWIKITPSKECKTTGAYKHDKVPWWKEKIIPWMRVNGFPLELTGALCDAGAEELKGRKKVAVPHFNGEPLASDIYVALKELVRNASSEKESKE